MAVYGAAGIVACVIVSSFERGTMDDVTDLNEWRQRRTIVGIAEKVEAMARALGADAADEAAAPGGDAADPDLDLPF